LAATDGEREVRLIYYAFDFLHLDGWAVLSLSLIERKALLDPLVESALGIQFNGHETGDGELIFKHDGKLGFDEVSKTIDAPYAPGNRGLWRKAKALNRKSSSSSAGPTLKDLCLIFGRSYGLLHQRRHAHLRRRRK
jgi:ATP-dependent DNA ligase